MQVLTDADVARLLTPELVRGEMRRAVVAAARGDLVAPPRVAAGLAVGRLTFTCGELRGAQGSTWHGYRSYLAPGSTGDEQLVVVHGSDGAVQGVVVGSALGPRRVGGIGAVALETIGPHRADRIAVIGSGNQAWHQLWALPEHLRTAAIRVHSPTPDHRDLFARRAEAELGLDCAPVASAVDAVDGAEVVILATASAEPVLPVDALAADACVTTLGPKQVGRCEFGPDLVEGATLLVSDSPAQIGAYDPPNVLAGRGIEDRLVHLGDLVSGAVPIPDGPGRRVFFSVGLAGTEVWLAHRLLKA